MLLVPLLLLAAAPAEDRILILELEHAKEQAETARLLNDLLATSAEEHSDLDVVTGADLKRVVELEAERQAAGCDADSEACLAEIAGAMGANLIVFGQVGKLGDSVLVTINVFDASTSSSRGRRSLQVDDEAALPKVVDRAVAELIGSQTGGTTPPIVGLSVMGGGLLVAALGYGGAMLANGALGARDGTGKDGAFVAGHISLWGGLVVGAALVTTGALMSAGVME